MFSHENKIRIVISGLEKLLELISQMSSGVVKERIIIHIMEMRRELGEILHELDWRRQQATDQASYPPQPVNQYTGVGVRERERTPRPRPRPRSRLFNRNYDENGLPIIKEIDKNEKKKEGDEVIYDEG